MDGGIRPKMSEEACGIRIDALDENDEWTGLSMFCVRKKGHKGSHGVFLNKDVSQTLYDDEEGSDPQ